MASRQHEVVASDLILEVAAKLTQPFSAETLVYEVWKAHPERFGLKGYTAKSADSNKVLAYLMGVKGLVKKLYLTRTESKMYRVGPKRLEADAVNLKPGVSVPSYVVQLLQSKVAVLIDANRADRIDWDAAVSFWGGSTVDDVDTFEKSLRKLDDDLPEVRKLRNVHSLLCQKFSKRLDIMRRHQERTRIE